MNICNYFDSAATAPMLPGVLEAMLPTLHEDFGNAHSLHTWGIRARDAVENARSQVASLLACSPEEITFTSGATESNNWILQSFPNVAVSPFEHSSIREQAIELGYGFLDHEEYEVELDPEADICSVMLVNNETGAILGCSGSGKLHRDITQAIGKIPVALEGLDYASFSSHKIGGPKGVGALYIKNAEPLEPLLYGGGQENGLRSGTLNVAGIVGFGMACQLVQGHAVDFGILRETVLSELAGLEDWQENRGAQQASHILSISFAGVEGETLVVEADSLGYAISSGAACSSRNTEPSHVLTALDVEDEMIRGTIRISFGPQNTIESARNLAKVLRDTLKRLR